MVLRSAPEQNAPPAPRKMNTRTFESTIRSSRARPNRWTSSGVSAFLRWGRCKVSVTAPGVGPDSTFRSSSLDSSTAHNMSWKRRIFKLDQELGPRVFRLDQELGPRVFRLDQELGPRST